MLFFFDFRRRPNFFAPECDSANRVRNGITVPTKNNSEQRKKLESSKSGPDALGTTFLAKRSISRDQSPQSRGAKQRRVRRVLDDAPLRGPSVLMSPQAAPFDARERNMPNFRSDPDQGISQSVGQTQG
jgi:hypothetical protein